MDFEFTDEQQRLKEEVRAFLEKEIAPIADERDARGPLTREELVGYIKKLMPFGYYNGMIPKELGGKGFSNTTMAMLIEELSRVWSGLSAAIWIASSMNPMIVNTPYFREKYLKRVMAGELIACGAITEPDAGSNAAAGYACEAAVRVATKALEIHGAMGIDENHSIHRYLRDARSLPTPDGTTQIQKLVIGREAIGIRAFNES